MASYKPDISHYHPVKNWDKVKESCPVLITKATQGTTYIDPTLGAFIANCESRGIPYWLYAYLNRGNELAQAQYLVKVCSQRIRSGSKYFIGYILDVEAGNSAANVQKALEWLNKQGKKTMLYTMWSEYRKYQTVIANRGSTCAWWEARYGANNGKDTSAKYPCTPGVDLHQYTSKGYCPGIPGQIDLNKIMNKPLAWYTSGTAAASSGPVYYAPAGSTLELAYNVMLGKYGSGEERKKMLANRYEEVQKFINEIQYATVDTLANGVIMGKYGSGDVRKTVLANRYAEVQKRVNQLM